MLIDFADKPRTARPEHEIRNVAVLTTALRMWRRRCQESRDLGHNRNETPNASNLWREKGGTCHN